MDNINPKIDPFWKVLELLGPVPGLVKKFLVDFGYDSYVALKGMTNDEIETLSKSHGLLPGHMSVLRGYRDLVAGSTWEKLLRQTRTAEKPLGQPPVTPENTFKKFELNEDLAKELSNKFRARLIQWIKVEALELHRNVKENDIKIKEIISECETKFGVICPFCGALIMLFYKLTSKTTFHVVTTNFTKHYNCVHLGAKSTDTNKKQASLFDLIKSSGSKRKADNGNLQSGSAAKVSTMDRENLGENIDASQDHEDIDLTTDDIEILYDCAREYKNNPHDVVRNRSKVRLLQLSNQYDMNQTRITYHFACSSIEDNGGSQDVVIEQVDVKDLVKDNSSKKKQHIFGNAVGDYQTTIKRNEGSISRCHQAIGYVYIFDWWKIQLPVVHATSSSTGNIHDL